MTGGGNENDVEGSSKRIILLGKSDKSFCNNHVTTAKYTVRNFLPIVRPSSIPYLFYSFTSCCYLSY